MKIISVGILLLVAGCSSPLPPIYKSLAVNIDTLLTYSNRCTVMCDFIAPCTGVIQYKDNLTDASWTVLWTGVITNTQTISVSFTNINVPHRYYRAFTTYP